MSSSSATRTPVENCPGIYERVGSRGTTYQMVFRDADGKQKWRSFKTLPEAQKEKVRRGDDVKRGDYVNDRDRTTVAEYARLYVDSRAHEQRPATRARQLSIVATHIEGTRLGTMPLARVRREHVDVWLGERAAVVQHSTLRILGSLLRATFSYAVENRRITTAPSVVLAGKRRTVDEGRVYAPSVAEVRRLAEAMPTATTKALVVVQAGTGTRVSELLALRVCDVSIPFRTVKVTAQLSRRSERIPTKTPESERTVPMSDAVADALAGLIADDAQPDALVFSAHGRPIRQNTYHVQFKAAVKRAALPASLSSHDLRHHTATTWLRAGLSPVAVGHLLGHADGSLVVKTYGHWMPEDDTLARAILDTAWGSEPQPAALRAVR